MKSGLINGDTVIICRLQADMGGGDQNNADLLAFYKASVAGRRGPGETPGKCQQFGHIKKDRMR